MWEHQYMTIYLWQNNIIIHINISYSIWNSPKMAMCCMWSSELLPSTIIHSRSLCPISLSYLCTTTLLPNETKVLQLLFYIYTCMLCNTLCNKHDQCSTLEIGSNCWVTQENHLSTLQMSTASCSGCWWHVGTGWNQPLMPFSLWTQYSFQCFFNLMSHFVGYNIVIWFNIIVINICNKLLMIQ